ncbi:class I SAM-dependent methyltransferase [Trinickia sp. Y13]|uniref:class I SAM-dependent methyltransferase n=1 Tax=Trinickia sp. Y13 TaxID=2917807 RepID=UPI00240671D6|nr:class I SAM-dependent methyltransferase [Trinickia sp. Y13]MDG0024004.1 class I SAM-dependent methyltransferase [Trinickia sp. Y13]
MTHLPDDAASSGAPGSGGPSKWVVRWSRLVEPGGAVLDVAAGAGRHARWFAGRGHEVVAIDRAEAALAALAEVPGVTPVRADLEDGSGWPLPETERFAAVVVTNYLNRALLPRLVQCLAPGGIFLYETFARGNETVGRPSNPAFLLEPGELLAAAHGRLSVIAYENGYVTEPRPAFVQRICAALPAQPLAAGVVPPRYDLAG